MNIGKWFTNLSFFKKMMLIYIVTAVLPLTAITWHSYRTIYTTTKEEKMKDLQYHVNTTAKNINSHLDSYDAIVDMIYMNQPLYIYLSVDYSNLSFEDMFFYIDNYIKNVSGVFSEIDRISFYSTNTTLPSDNFYFYSTEDLPTDALKVAKKYNGKPVFFGNVEKNGKSYIGVIRKMNYYDSGSVENYLYLQIDRQQIESLLQKNSSDKNHYLVTEEGKILASSDVDLAYNNMGQIIPNWENCEDGYILRINNDNVIIKKQQLELGAQLICLSAEYNIYDGMIQSTGNLALIFVVSTILMFVVSLLYNKHTEKRVTQILIAMEKMGNDNYDFSLSEAAEDEIGQIARGCNQLRDQIRFLVRENYEKKILIKSSELNLLQEQINPHFLYNALSVISSLAIKEGEGRTVQSVRYLANFYRMSLQKGKKIVTIKEEIALVDYYMKIQKIRFEDSIQVEYDVDESILGCQTIKLLLQPLVENAVLHGRKEEGVLHIGVSVKRAGDHIEYGVQDDGVGIEKEKLENLKKELAISEEGFGIKNVNIRVKLQYGEQYGLSIDSEYQKGTRLAVTIPVCNM